MLINNITAKHYLANMVCFNCKLYNDIILIPSGKKLKYKNPHCVLNNKKIPKEQTCEFWVKL